MKRASRVTPHLVEKRVAFTGQHHAWRLLALWALIFAAYSNSFQAGLVYDNAVAIAEDSRVRAATPENFRLILTRDYRQGGSPTALYRPLTTFSYLVNYAVLGNRTRPAGYHWLNLLLHAVNVGLVYALGLTVFDSATLAWALAAIWGLHPLLTESVTNIVGRADLLAAFGVLAGLLCYIKGSAVQGRGRLAWAGALMGAQAVGIFSKESAVVLPGVMLLYDLTWPAKSRRGRAPFYAALAPPFAAFLWLRSQVPTHLVIGAGENPMIEAAFWTARLTAMKVIGKYLALFAWPARLSADYSYNAVPLFRWRLTNWQDAQAFITLAVCTLGAVLVVRCRQKCKPLFFFPLFFFLTLLPTSNLFLLIGAIMAERFLYLPSIGLAGCAVAASAIAWRRLAFPQAMARRAAWAAAALICVGLGARTYARNSDWHDELSLWNSAVAACPQSFKAHDSLGNALVELPGRLPDAITEYRSALRIKPDFPEGHYNLGVALSQMPGHMSDAIAEYQAALRYDSNFVKAHNNLGMAYSEIPSRLPDALAEFDAALRIDPGFLDAHNNRGMALSQIPGRLPEAIAEYQTVLRIRPDYWEAHYNLGSALLRMPGRLGEAIAEFETVLSLRPDPRVRRLVDQLRARQWQISER